jgi:hypothetical protein
MPGFTGFVLSVVGDIPVDSETLVMPSSVSSRGFVAQSLKVLIWVAFACVSS